MAVYALDPLYSLRFKAQGVAHAHAAVMAQHRPFPHGSTVRTPSPWPLSLDDRQQPLVAHLTKDGAMVYTGALRKALLRERPRGAALAHAKKTYPRTCTELAMLLPSGAKGALPDEDPFFWVCQLPVRHSGDAVEAIGLCMLFRSLSVTRLDQGLRLPLYTVSQ
jgi:hypothetical protein